MNTPLRPPPIVLGEVALATSALMLMMPMAMIVASSGQITLVGPTLQAIAGEDLVGARVNEVFEFRRPRSLHNFADLLEILPARLRLRLKKDRFVELNGLAVALGQGRGVLINTGPGVGLLARLGRHGLTASDFAPTDVVPELAYVLEAKTATMAEARRLAERLDGERSVARALAISDPLTGLLNRRGFEERLAPLQAHGFPFGLVHLDLDLFKSVNDRFGHAAGDHVLVSVAAALRAETRASDLVGRIGGDEFVIATKGLADTDRLLTAAKRMIERIERPMVNGAETYRVSASIGITSTLICQARTIEGMHHEADIALYEAKRSGRGHAQVWRSDLEGDGKT